MSSGLRGRASEMQGHLEVVDILDDSVHMLELLDILPKGVHQPLGVLRGHDDAGLDTAFRRAGHHVDVVQHELGVAVGDDGEVGVLAFGDVLGNLDVKLIGVLVGHIVGLAGEGRENRPGPQSIPLSEKLK